MEPKVNQGERATSPPSAIKLLNPKGLLVPEVQDLINGGLKPLFDGGLDPEAVWLELAKWVAGQQGIEPGVFLGYENGKFLSFLLLEPSRLPFDPYPNIVFFQNLGSNALKRAMAAALLDHLRQIGHTTVSLHNGSKTADSVYVRALCKPGVAKLTGTRILWRLIGEESREGSIRRVGKQLETSRRDAKRRRKPAKNSRQRPKGVSKAGRRA